MKRVAIPLLLLAATACQTPQWPVNGPIRSPYGIRIAGIGGELHRGVDIGVAIGTPVRPMLNGRVRFAGTMSGYGQVIWVDHGEDVLTVYAHLSALAVEAGRDPRSIQIMAFDYGGMLRTRDALEDLEAAGIDWVHLSLGARGDEGLDALEGLARDLLL